MNYGYIRVGAAAPSLKVADCDYNGAEIVNIIALAAGKGIQFLVFPELSITAYTCGDLFLQQTLIKGAVDQLGVILEKTKNIDTVVMLGMPLFKDNRLFNCAVMIKNGNILGVVPKSYIPGYSEFYEERWFASGADYTNDTLVLRGQKVAFGTDLLFEDENDPRICFGVEICEDLWVPIPPSAYQALAGATMLFNLSASNEIIGKHEYRKMLVSQQSGKCIAAYIYTSSNACESSTDLVFGGHALIAEYGSVLAESERFSSENGLLYTEVDVERLINDRCKNTTFMENKSDKKFRRISFKGFELDLKTFCRGVDPYPFVPSNDDVRDLRCQEIFSIQTSALSKRLKHSGVKHAVIGISGGLDSTLALLVTVKTFDLLGFPRKNIHAITMPGFGTTDETYANALKLIESMEADCIEIDIKEACMQHFKDIGHDASQHDVTYENVQARERTQILMDIANKIGGLVIGTGDLSELALGWCTYNGDHMSMYGVNSGIPKTLVKYLVQWVKDHVSDNATKEVLQKIIQTPISPELLPPDISGEIKQKTEELVGPYELHDFFLYHSIRYGAPPAKILFLAGLAFKSKYSKDIVKKWLKIFYQRFFSQQFKRSCMPDGPKVGTISLSPRGDWRMPSDAEVKLWLKELE